MKVKIIYDNGDLERYSLIKTDDLELLITIVKGFENNNQEYYHNAHLRIETDENGEDLLIITNYNYYVE